MLRHEQSCEPPHSLVRKWRGMEVAALPRDTGCCQNQDLINPHAFGNSRRVQLFKLQMQMCKKTYTFFPTVDLTLSFCPRVEIGIQTKESFPGFGHGHSRFKLSCVRSPSPHPHSRGGTYVRRACVGAGGEEGASALLPSASLPA